MTAQPPPPPPGGTPPPPGQWGPPPGGAPAPFDPKTVNPLDWAILGIGVLTLIFSFFSFYSYSETHCGGQCVSVDNGAWHGFFGWFAVLVALIGAVLVALDLFMPQVKLPVPNRLLGLGAFALATVCMIIALFLIPDGSYNGFTIDSGASDVDAGHGFSFWLCFILIIAGLVVSLMRFQQTGGQLPGALAGVPNIGQRGPQGGIPGGQAGSYAAGHRPGPEAGTPAPPPPAGGAAPPPPGSAAPPPPGSAVPPPPGDTPPPPPGYGPPR